MSLFINVQHVLQTKNNDNLTLNVATDFPIDKHIVGIFGESGSGKTTLLKAVANLSDVQQRDIVFQSKNISEISAQKSPICYQNQHGVLFPHLTVVQNLMLVATHSEYTQQAKFTFEQIVDWCQLAELLPRSVNELSGGEIQRVSFARSLLSGKPLILLDEPFSALDWPLRNKMLKLVSKLHHAFNIGFIFVSHSLYELAQVASYIVEVRKGRVVQQGGSNQLIAKLASDSEQQTVSALTAEFVEHLAEFNLDKVKLDSTDEQFVYLHPQPYQSNKVLISLPANHISLSVVKPSKTSIVNQLQAVVRQIEAFDDHALITLSVGQQVVLAEISLMSLTALAFSHGDKVYIQFKVI